MGTLRVNGSSSGYVELVPPANAGSTSINLPNSSVDLSSSFSAWTSYTPSWTSSGTAPSLGNGTITGRYKQIGKTVFVFVKLNIGSTSTMGTGDWRFSLPVPAQNPDCIQFPVSILDNGVAWYQGTANGTYTGLTDRTSIITDGTGATSGAVTASNPFTWGTGDSLQFNGSYEAA